MSDPGSDLAACRASLLDAILPHVPFDGWSDAAFRNAIKQSGVAPDIAQLLCPRGAIDLAAAYHARGDAEMVRALSQSRIGKTGTRDRVAHAIRLRLQAIGPREVARRSAALYALPNHTLEGARLIWTTADQIWVSLGDRSEDFDWYSKRASLAAVYSATLLFWLGDESTDHADSRAFIERRLDQVMRVEKAKTAIGENTFFRAAASGTGRIWRGLRDGVRRTAPADLPGRMASRPQ